MPTMHLALLTAALLAPALATAQTTYRWIDPGTGSTVISDKPPPPGAKQVSRRGGETPTDEGQLPYATRQAVEKFPVTLYTTAGCVTECKTARDMLNGRGVPFTEKILKNQEEADELAKQFGGGEPGLPSISVGRQNFKGFEYTAWNNLLDLAGYPKSAPYGAKPSGAFAK